MTARPSYIPMAYDHVSLQHRPVGWALALAVVLCCWLWARAAAGYSYIVVLKDGRTVPVDLYGEVGEEIFLHRDGQVMKVPRTQVREVRRAGPADPRPPGRTARHEVGGVTLLTFESDVSSLGWGSAKEEHQWLEDLLLQERGDPCDPQAVAIGAAVRWVRSPSVSCFGGGEPAAQAVKAAVSELNEALAPAGMVLRLGPQEDRQAEIQVFFRPRAAFPAGLPLDRAHLDGCARILRAGSEAAVIRAAQVWVAEDPQLEVAIAHLDPQARRQAAAVLLQERWQALVLHELIHALGLTHSAVFRDSTMYCRARGNLRQENRQTRLSLRDRKVLAFFYTHIQPGDRAGELRRAADGYWFDF